MKKLKVTLNTSFWTHKANNIAKFLSVITTWRYFYKT